VASALRQDAGRVLVVEPMSSGLAVPPLADSLGDEVVVASYDRDDRRLPDSVRPHIHRLLEIDTNDGDAVSRAVADLHRERPFAGVVPGFEYYVPLASRLAAELGLPGLPVGSVRAVRDKAEMLACAEENGLRVPAWTPAASEHEAVLAGAKVGYPCVVKPVGSSGSVHVTRADTEDDLVAAYRALVTDAELDLGRPLGGRVVVAEYVAGPEFSVEGHVTGDEVVVVSVTEKLLGPEPYFVEIGHIVQAELEAGARDRIERYVRDVVPALGVTLGPFHCELRLAGTEPVLIELGARLGGDHIAELVRLATGVSLPHVMLAAYTGRPLDTTAPPFARYAGIRYLTAPTGTTRYRRLSGLDDVARLPGVLSTGIEVPAGTPIPAPSDGRCRIAHTIFVADSHDEALRTWRRIGEMVHCD
jgi:biotin carboxylase